MQQTAYNYRDPVTDFVHCLYVDYDFDLAQQKLVECEKVLVMCVYVTARLLTADRFLNHLVRLQAS